MTAKCSRKHPRGHDFRSIASGSGLRGTDVCTRTCMRVADCRTRQWRRIRDRFNWKACSSAFLLHPSISICHFVHGSTRRVQNAAPARAHYSMPSSHPATHPSTHLAAPSFNAAPPCMATVLPHNPHGHSSAARTGSPLVVR